MKDKPRCTCSAPLTWRKDIKDYWHYHAEDCDVMEKKMQTFKTTVREVFEALEKNGFEHLRGSWFTYSYDGPDNLVVGGCILGQAAINLGAYQPVDDEDRYEEFSLLGALSFPATDSKWNKEEVHETVGDQIIFWNDKQEYNEGGFIKYALPTWEAVVEMAKDCLMPYFDETVTLAKYDWNTEKEVLVW